MRILVVDDDRDVLDATASALLMRGYQVYKAGDGKEALSVLKHREPVDVVVTDFAMPMMNGIQLSLHIRKDSPTQRIIIHTGSNSVADCLPEYGLTDVPVLHKPYRIEALMQLLES